MTKLTITEHLTSVDSDLDRAVAATHVGMAHWSGTGPAGSTCGQCSFWLGRHGDKAAACARYWQLINRAPLKNVGKVPRHAASCKYFAERPA